jgi:hypothetical protein
MLQAGRRHPCCKQDDDSDQEQNALTAYPFNRHAGYAWSDDSCRLDRHGNQTGKRAGG